MASAKTKHQIKWAELGNCEVIYRDAQRADVNERTIRKIIDAFDPDAFGIPFVAQVNGNGHYHIIDGQNRVTALKRMGWGNDQMIEVEVVQVKDKAEAARLFILRNTFQSPSAVDRFIASVTARSEEHVAANTLVQEAGFSIGHKPTASTVAAVGAVMRSYQNYGDVALLAALMAISATWRADSDRTRGEIIEAWAWLFHDFGQVIDASRLASRVGKKYTAGSLIGTARADRNVFGGKLTTSVLRVTVGQYNAGLRVNARIELEL